MWRSTYFAEVATLELDAGPGSRAKAKAIYSIREAKEKVKITPDNAKLDDTMTLYFEAQVKDKETGKVVFPNQMAMLFRYTDKAEREKGLPLGVAKEQLVYFGSSPNDAGAFVLPVPLSNRKLL